MSTSRFSRFALRTNLITSRRSIAAPFATRTLHQSRLCMAEGSNGNNSNNDDAVLDALAEGKVKGRTGGGEPLSSSSKNAAAKPKISNLSVPGASQTEHLTEEQKKEVEEHNRDFDAKHDHGNEAPDDKVDKKFWTGGN